MNDMDQRTRSLVEAARRARPDDVTRKRIRAGLDARLALIAAAGVGAGSAAIGASAAAAATEGAVAGATAAGTTAAGTAVGVAATGSGVAGGGVAGGGVAGGAVVATSGVVGKAGLFGVIAKVGLAVALVGATGVGVRAMVTSSAPPHDDVAATPSTTERASIEAPASDAAAEAAPTPPSPTGDAVAAVPASAEPIAVGAARTGAEGSARRDAASIAAEVALLRKAQASLREGDSKASLEAIDALAAKHPDGALREERDAARVLALCAAGRVDDARVEALRFLSRWPRSLQAARVRASCAFARAK